ncbi:hypothetical protein SRHO_G00007830 [Serrasalmus rhombeus]
MLIPDPGMALGLETMMVSPTPSRAQAILSRLTPAINNESLQYVDCSSASNSNGSAVTAAIPMDYTPFDSTQFDTDTLLRITCECLLAWRKLGVLTNGVHLGMNPSRNVVITTDASFIGRGVRNRRDISRRQ